MQLDAPVFTDDMEQRLLAERKIADILGTEFFFDRFWADELAFKSVPQLAEALRQAAVTRTQRSIKNG